MATTVQIFAEQLRGSISTPTASVTVPAGAPRDFTLNILSSDWLTVAGHELDIVLERSLDGGTTWQQVLAAHAVSGPTRFNAPPQVAASWDGQAGLARFRHILTTVNGVADATFTWGLSVTV